MNINKTTLKIKLDNILKDNINKFDISLKDAVHSVFKVEHKRSFLFNNIYGVYLGKYNDLLYFQIIKDNCIGEKKDLFLIGYDYFIYENNEFTFTNGCFNYYNYGDRIDFNIEKIIKVGNYEIKG